MAAIMATLELAYAYAYASACDAANRSMRKAGRAEWNDDDATVFLAAFETIYALTPQAQMEREWIAQHNEEVAI